MAKREEEAAQYPWYRVVTGAELQQGDIILGCPVIVVKGVAAGEVGDEPETIGADQEERDCVVMTQSCDLAKKGKEPPHVLLCPLADLDAQPLDRDQLRQGRHTKLHLIDRCEIDGHAVGYRVVDLSVCYTLPFDVLQRVAAQSGARLRLSPPYREHLAQAFARLYMRVGLPTDIQFK